MEEDQEELEEEIGREKEPCFIIIIQQVSVLTYRGMGQCLPEGSAGNPKVPERLRARLQRRLVRSLHSTRHLADIAITNC